MLLKDPYILDFLGLSDRFLERDLEDAIQRELETFILEMGSVFSFAGSSSAARSTELLSSRIMYTAEL
jgi:predicted nuclease of restriction endonuclease-like (RecB) superfamily